MVKQTRGYRVWDPASEDALKQGVRKHGLGAWEHIRKDPQFAILSDRTGVQLKDKWRNLVKFRHIDPDEQRTYKPKTQGPWSKKYKRERSQGLSGTASPGSDDGGGVSADEGGHNHNDLALQGNGSAAVDSTDPASAAGVSGATAVMTLPPQPPPPPQPQLPQPQHQQHQQQPSQPHQHPQGLLAQRQSGRTNAQKRKAITDLALMLEGEGGDGYHGSEDDERGPGTMGCGSGAGGDGTDGGDGGGSASRRGRPRPLLRPVGRSSGGRYRKTQEDRRFGIYDRRRYGFAEDGTGGPPRARSYDGEGSDDGHGSDAEGLHGGGGAHGGHGGAGAAHPPRIVRRRFGPSRRRFSDDDDDDEEDEEPDEGSDDGMEGGGRRGGGGNRRGGSTARGGGAHAGASEGGDGGEQYIIACPCGVTYDDGEMMIECESCAAWAHVACLKQQMVTAPDRYRYNFDTYHCANCQDALQSLQQGPGPGGELSTGPGGGGSDVRQQRHGGGMGFGSPGSAHGRHRHHMARGGQAAEPQCAPRIADPDADCDTASEDSQRKASELSNILLGLANGRLGSGGSASVGGNGVRRAGSMLPNAPPPGLTGPGGGMPRYVHVVRPSTPAAGQLPGGGMPGLNSEGASGRGVGAGGGAGGGGGSPMERSASLGRTNSSCLGAGAGAAGQGGSLEGSSRLLLKPGPAMVDGVRRGLVAGPANSGGSRGRLDGAASPPPILDGSLPLFQGNGPGSGAGSGAGTKIFKPIPKLATAGGLSEPHRQGQPQQLSAPKARPHPALQHGASQNNMQRMLEAANPLASVGTGGSASGPGRGLPLTSVLEAAGPLQVAVANLCAASGRKPGGAPAAAPAASTGGAPAASDGVGSCDAAATGAGGLPPRPPSRPPSSMAREVANRIFGESDDDDAAALGRPLSALRGATTDPWFLMPASLSRAATPSAFIDTILRATPDIVPMPGTSPPPTLAAALATVRPVSPGAAYLPALLAQQQQHQAAMQHFLQQSAPSPVSANPLQPGPPAAGSAAASAAASVLLPPPLLARPPPLQAPPPPPFAPPSVPIGGWPPSVPLAPPPPGPLHSPATTNGESVQLHPVLCQLLLNNAQQHQQQQQQGSGPQQPPHQGHPSQPPHQGQAPQQHSASGAPAGPGAGLPGDPGSIRIKEEIVTGPSPPPLPQRQHPHSLVAAAAAGGAPPASQTPVSRCRPSTGGDNRSNGGACGLSAAAAAAQILRGTALPLPGTGVSNGSTSAQAALVNPHPHLQAHAALAGRDAAAAALAMAAAAAAAASSAGGLGGGTVGGGSAGGLPPGLDAAGGNSVAALLGLHGGLHLNIMDHLRSSSPDPWGFFRTSTPGPEALLQGFLHPPPSVPVDINSLPWLKSATPPLSVDMMGHPPAGGTDLHLDR